MSALKTYLDKQNSLNSIFGLPTLQIPRDAKAIRERIESELSPENFTCDGELSKTEVARRYRVLTRALEDLNRQNL